MDSAFMSFACPSFLVQLLLTHPWSALSSFRMMLDVGRENQALTHINLLEILKMVRPLSPTQTVILIGKHSYLDRAIAIHRLPLTVPSQSSGSLSLDYICDCIAKQRGKGCESLQTETFKKENCSCWILFFSIPHSASTKRFTCHHRLPSSFNKRSKRKRRALSGRVWLFKTIGILV